MFYFHGSPLTAKNPKIKAIMKAKKTLEGKIESAAIRIGKLIANHARNLNITSILS